MYVCVQCCISVQRCWWSLLSLPRCFCLSTTHKTRHVLLTSGSSASTLCCVYSSVSSHFCRAPRAVSELGTCGCLSLCFCVFCNNFVNDRIMSSYCVHWVCHRTVPVTSQSDAFQCLSHVTAISHIHSVFRWKCWKHSAMLLLQQMLPCVVCMSVCLSVWPSFTLVHPAKAVGRNEMPFSRDLFGPK